MRQMSSFVVRVGVVVTLLSAAACKKEVAAIDITPARLSFRGETEPKPLVATPKDADGLPFAGELVITWTSSNPAIATVDATGKVKAKGSGKTTVKAEVGEAVGTAIVDVVLVKSIKIETNAMVVRVGEKSKPLQILFMNEKGEPVDGKDAQLEWRSSNPNIATVAPDGSVTGVAPGSTLVQARVGELATDVAVSVLTAEAPPPAPTPPAAEQKPGDPAAPATPAAPDAKPADAKPADPTPPK